MKYWCRDYKTGNMRPSTSSDRRKSTLLPPHTSFFWEDETLRETCQFFSGKQAGGSVWKPHFQQSRAWAGGSIPCVRPQQWQKILNPTPRHEDSSDCTSREFHSFLFLTFSESKRAKKGLRGREGNEELAPETVTSCCQYKAVKMCLRLPKPWDWLTK